MDVTRQNPGYLRLSYKLDPNGALVEEDRDGLTRQRADLSTLAARFNAEVGTVFEEDDTSASKKRGAETEWARLLSYIRKHRPTYVFATAVDRVTRNYGAAQDFEDACGTTTTLVTLREGAIDFESSQWTYAVAQARQESINTRSRVRRGQLARRATGKDGHGGPRPYGYAQDKMTLIPDEVLIIEEIHRRILRGDTGTGIAVDFQKRKVPTTRPGSRWTAVMVRRIAENPRYAGILVHKGEHIGTAAWPAIIDLNRHHALLDALKTSAQPKRGKPVTSLLSGIVRCSCGQTMNATISGPTTKTPVYRCSGGRGRFGCGKVYRSRQLVNDFVIRHILANVDDVVIARERRAIADQLEPMEIESTELMVAIGQIEDAYRDKDIDRLFGLLDGRTYTQRWDELTGKQAALARAMGKLQRQWTALGSGTQAAQRWESWSDEERRAFIASRIEAVRIHPSPGVGPNRPLIDGELVIEWRTATVDSDPDWVDPRQTAEELAR